MAGAVWAADHTEPRARIVGGYPAVLAMRDLASGNQRVWKPVETMEARETVKVLDVRMAHDGAPLVLKSENGSALGRIIKMW